MSSIVGYMVGEGLLGNPAYDTGPLVVEGLGEWVDGTESLIMVGMDGYSEAIVADGVDYTAADRRPHYRSTRPKPHYTAADRRPHYTVS